MVKRTPALKFWKKDCGLHNDRVFLVLLDSLQETFFG